MWNQIEQFASTTVLGISISEYILAFLAILGGFVMKWASTGILARMSNAAATTKTRLDDLVLDAFSKPLGWSFLLLGLYGGTRVIPFPIEPVNLNELFGTLYVAGFTLILIWFTMRLNDRLCEYWMEKANNTESRLDDQAIPIIRRTVKAFIVIIGLSLFLQNMGYSVTSLIAGLGLGGAALAFASKDALANLFGAVVIFLDRPFQVGDWIEISGVEGTVEEVGLRTTRIRTFANSLITLPNSQLSVNSINNWSHMKKRRIKMSIGLTYDSNADQMQAAVDAIRDIIKNDENIHQDFYLVNFDTFGAYSLEIFVYCFTVTTNWAEFLDVKQQFMLKIMRAMEALGLEFAFPTQTLHVNSFPAANRPQEPAMSERPM